MSICIMNIFNFLCFFFLFYFRLRLVLVFRIEENENPNMYGENHQCFYGLKMNCGKLFELQSLELVGFYRIEMENLQNGMEKKMVKIL